MPKRTKNHSSILPTIRPVIQDRFEDLRDLMNAMRQVGLESSELIVGIDYTKSNEWKGNTTFGHRCLHALDEEEQNLYEWVLTAIANTMEKLDDDSLIPCYGFGDATTKQYGVFPFFPHDDPANGLNGVLERYKKITPHVDLSGSTNFAPLIHQALHIVCKSLSKPLRTQMDYHILLILTDGQVTAEYSGATKQAIELASHYPLSIIMIGIGDGPWNEMSRFGDSIKNGKFDNFKFVDLSKIMEQSAAYPENQQQQYDHFALNALMKVPSQYEAILHHKLMEEYPRRDKIRDDVLLELPPKLRYLE